MPQGQFGIPAIEMGKRSIADTIVGIYISDVWSTVRDSIWTNPEIQTVKGRQSNLEKGLSETQKVQNLTILTQEAITRAVEINANLIETNQNDIMKVITNHPALMVVSADIVCRLHQQINLLDRIRAPFESKTQDLVSLSLLLKEDTEIMDVDSTSLIHKKPNSFPQTLPKTY